jgi:hypothetical protein
MKSYEPLIKLGINVGKQKLEVMRRLLEEEKIRRVVGGESIQLSSAEKARVEEIMDLLEFVEMWQALMEDIIPIAEEAEAARATLKRGRRNAAGRVPPIRVS